MMTNNPTDKQIIKALECCGSGHAHDSCDQCPLHHVKGCYDTVLNDYALGLIHRQQAEIARLEKANGVLLCAKDAMEANCIALQKQLEELEVKE